MVDSLLDQFGLDDVSWNVLSHPALHPGRAAEICVQGERIGIVGEVHPSLAQELGVSDIRLAIAELNFQRILTFSGQAKKAEVKVARYLPVEQDFAIIVDRTVSASDVQAALRQSAGPLLTKIALFDVFEGAQIGDDKRSLAYRLTFTAPDRALTDAELGKVRKRIERGIQTQVNGSLRA